MSKGIKPIFPKRCVLSGKPDPDSTVVIIANQHAFGGFFGLRALYHGWTRVRAPIHRAYKGRFYLQAFGREILLALGICIGVWLLMALTQNSDNAIFRTVTATVGGLLGCIPAILFALYLPPRFDVAVGDDWIDYQFLSPDYATEFARLNEAHVIQK